MTEYTVPSTGVLEYWPTEYCILSTSLTMPYAELHAKSNFSFLEGASHPEELVERAAELRYAALAVTDRNSLAGVVRPTWRPRSMA